LAAGGGIRFLSSFLSSDLPAGAGWACASRCAVSCGVIGRCQSAMAGGLIIAKVNAAVPHKRQIAAFMELKPR
jgi:hypothetical protein